MASLYYYTVYQGKYGGFISNGTGIALLGFSLLFATQRTKVFRQVTLIAVMIAVSFFLSTSRADMLGMLVVLVFIVGVFNRQMLRSFLNQRRWRTVLILSVIVFAVLLNAGIKSQIRWLSSYGHVNYVDLSLDAMLGWGRDRILDRFSQQGLYDGYCNLVNRLSDGTAPFFHGRVIAYTTTAWVPYVIYKDKPQHPFRAVGYLVYDDYHTSLDDVSATMLVGSAFADYGIWSVIFYLFVYGFILGGVRRVTIRQRGHILLFIWYIHFTLVDGASNMIHGGIVNFFDAFFLASGVMVLTSTYVRIRAASKPPARQALTPSWTARDLSGTR